VGGWEPIRSREPVYIPNADGSEVAETLWIEVDAWRDPATGEVYLDGDATEKLEAVKARHLGVLTAGQLRNLRSSLGFSQKQMAELLQLGEKSWTRWESGRDRPSRSMNVLLCALFDGKIDVKYLQELNDRTLRAQFRRWKPTVRWEATPYEGDEAHGWQGDGKIGIA
jgi:transcriptional regulator with XRE-family HTH domain